MLRSAVLVAAVLALPVPAAAAQDQGVSRDRPISVAGETISMTEIRHWARVAAAGEGVRPEHFGQVAQLLISIRWVHGEARALGVRVTGGQVGRAVRRQVHASFGSWREFHAFLRANGQTFADIRLRVRSDLESERLRKLAVGDATDPEEESERLGAYVEDFFARWRPQTVCTPRVAALTTECGNAPVE